MLVTDPSHDKFLSSTFLVLGKRQKTIAVIMFFVANKELLSVVKILCEEARDTFKEVIAEMQKNLHEAPEGTRLICRENMRDINDVDDFAVDHLWAYLPKYKVQAAHEDVARILRECFPGTKHGPMRK
jgi:hypothetical protein